MRGARFALMAVVAVSALYAAPAERTRQYFDETYGFGKLPDGDGLITRTLRTFFKDTYQNTIRFWGSNPFRRSVAVVIGINKYAPGSKLPSLERARQDAVDMRGFLNEYGFDMVYQFLDDKAQVEDLRMLMKLLARELRPDDRFLFFFSGHGDFKKLPHGQQENYLVFGDANAERDEGVIELGEVFRWSGNLKCFSQLFLLDSCYSGNIVNYTYRGDSNEIKGGLGQGVSRQSAAGFIQALARKGRHVLTATAPDQKTIELIRKDSPGGLFTRTFLEAVKEGKADDNHDGIITLDEIYRYVSTIVEYNVRGIGAITPKLHPLDPNENGKFFFVKPGSVAKPGIMAVLAGLARGGTKEDGEDLYYLNRAKDLVRTDPVEAFFLAYHTQSLQPSEDAQAVMQEALRWLSEKLRQQAAYQAAFSEGGLGSQGWFFGKLLVRFSSNLELTAVARNLSTPEEGNASEILLIRPPQVQSLRLGCKSDIRRVSDLRFSRSQRYILAATHAFLYLYNLRGELLAESCKWPTKDQWTYLDLLHDDQILLTSANAGQVMLYRLDLKAPQEKFKPLTGEFDYRRSGGPMISLQVDPEEKQLLSVHRLGYAYLWQFDPNPKERRGYLNVLHEFKAPPNSRNESPFTIRFKRDDEEWITSASMSSPPDPRYFVTTFKAGPAILWRMDGNEMKLVRRLDHSTGTVLYAAFSGDGSKILSLGGDRSAKIWDTATGQVLGTVKITWPDAE